MSSERGDRAWEAHHQASEKFDYFMAGLAAALSGFLGQQLHLSPLGLNASTAELLAVVAFGLSLFAAIGRIEWAIVVLGTSHRRLRLTEDAKDLAAKAIESPLLQSFVTGEMIDSHQALARARSMVAQGDEVATSVDKAVRRSESAYRWRNRLFYAGIALLVTARVAAAYGR